MESPLQIWQLEEIQLRNFKNEKKIPSLFRQIQTRWALAPRPAPCEYEIVNGLLQKDDREDNKVASWIYQRTQFTNIPAIRVLKNWRGKQVSEN